MFTILDSCYDYEGVRKSKKITYHDQVQTRSLLFPVQ